jgi:AraC-like DNA-binding protein
MKNTQENIKKVQIMEKLISNIHSYFEYLGQSCHLFCSVHFLEGSFAHLSTSLIAALTPHMIHNHPYCRYVKETGHHKQCMKNQKQIISALDGKDSILRTCHACVRELLYPIQSEARHVRGFIAVSAYRGKAEDGCIHDTTLFDTLNRTEPPKKLTDTLIPPLCMMIEQWIDAQPEEGENEFKRILNYLTENHAHVTLDALAAHFGRSRSHISHLFKANTGLSLRAYCNDLRLLDAKVLLQSTDLSISEIAYEAGFEDASYFIKLFREKYGSSPGKFQKDKTEH